MLQPAAEVLIKVRKKTDITLIESKIRPPNDSNSACVSL
jgi:hypothetical protein